MRTTLEIDEGLLKDVVALTKERSKSRAVCEALKEYIQQKRLDRLIHLMGQVEVGEDWRKLRDGELGEER
jgi:Arc/MetJ family transcription regulator